MKTKEKKKYWYKTEITECVLCGYTTKDRFRVYDEPKPEDTIFWKDDACSTHFI
jgi:Zn ribbon nucleic-acid-binding protein